MKILHIYMIIFLLSINTYSQCKEIIQQDLICNQGESEDYVSCKIDSSNNVEIFYKIDYSELLTSKTALKNNPLKDFYVSINGNNIAIDVKKKYYNLIPISVKKIQKERLLYVVEFNLISHIGLEGYSYLYIDCTNNDSVIFKEFDSEKRLTKNKILNKIKPPLVHECFRVPSK